MSQYGINGNILNVVQSMYANIKSCVFVDGNFSEYFISLRGVRQGENLSPLLFALFVNDLEFSLLNNDCHHVNFDLENVDNMLCLFELMYADDMVILANNPQKLKYAIKALESYCKEWHTYVNCSKTKMFVFGERKSQERCNYELFGEVMEKLDCYTYLGRVFHRRFGGEGVKRLKKY